MLKPKKPLKPTKLTPQEQYWNEVDAQARQLITNTFNHPIVEETYQDYLKEYQSQEEVPNESQETAQQLAYEYLLSACQSILEQLRNFSCHEPSYFEALIQYE